MLAIAIDVLPDIWTNTSGSECSQDMTIFPEKKNKKKTRNRNIKSRVNIFTLNLFCICFRFQMASCYGIRILFLCWLNILHYAFAEPSLKLQYQWKQVDFYNNSFEREKAIQTKTFVPENCILLDVDVWSEPEKRVFVTLPVFKPGVPATLATVKNSYTGLLAPFPNWESQNNCKGLTSVYRIQV